MSFARNMQTVNVDRIKLLEALKANLEIHRTEYAQALIDFKDRLEQDLKLAAKKVSKADPKDLKDFRFTVNFPQNHEREFVEVIDMLEHSVDPTINLDSSSFRAYIKNEWAWAGAFNMLNESYKIGGSMLR